MNLPILDLLSTAPADESPRTGSDRTMVAVARVLDVADGGVVRLHGEYTYPLEAGMTDRQLEDFVFGGCRLIVALMHEAEEQFPDELRGSLEP